MAIDLKWSTAGTFKAVGPAFVRDVVVADDRLLAVGVAYNGAIPNFGPSPPHQGRVWESIDGRSWTDITPVGGFANAGLSQAVVRADGSIVVMGVQATANDVGDLDQYTPRAWESSDGLDWRDADLGFGTDVSVRLIAGERGYLAHVWPWYADAGSELWFSRDARSWARVPEYSDGYGSVEAGDEGFVAIGDLGAIASADGSIWHESNGPPGTAALLPHGPDWLAFTRDPDLGMEDPVEVWRSENGLDWAYQGSTEPAFVDLGDGVKCYEWPGAVLSAGRWLVQSSALSYPCSEGGFVTSGVPRISSDGLSWQVLPFSESGPRTAGSGSGVSAAVSFGEDLVLAGNASGAATFWIGEAP